MTNGLVELLASALKRGCVCNFVFTRLPYPAPCYFIHLLRQPACNGISDIPEIELVVVGHPLHKPFACVSIEAADFLYNRCAGILLSSIVCVLSHMTKEVFRVYQRGSADNRGRLLYCNRELTRNSIASEYGYHFGDHTVTRVNCNIAADIIDKGLYILARMLTICLVKLCPYIGIRAAVLTPLLVVIHLSHSVLRYCHSVICSHIRHVLQCLLRNAGYHYRVPCARNGVLRESLIHPTHSI